MKTKILLLILISIVFTGCSASQASTSSEQPEQSQSQSNSSTDNRQLSQEQFEEIFDFYCEEQLTDFDGIEVIPALYGIDEEAFAISGEIVNGQLIYWYIPDDGAPQLFGKLDLRQNMIDIYYTESKEMDQYLQEVANGECQLYPTLIEKGGQKAYLMEMRNLKGEGFFGKTDGYFVLINYSEWEDDQGENRQTLEIDENYYFPMSVSSLPMQEEIRQALFSSDLNLQNTKAILLADNPLRRQPSILFYDGEKEYIMCLWDMGMEERIDRLQGFLPDMLAPVEYKADYRQYQLFPVTDFAQDYISENEYLEKQSEIMEAYYKEHNLPWPPVF